MLCSKLCNGSSIDVNTVYLVLVENNPLTVVNLLCLRLYEMTKSQKLKLLTAPKLQLGTNGFYTLFAPLKCILDIDKYGETIRFNLKWVQSYLAWHGLYAV